MKREGCDSNKSLLLLSYHFWKQNTLTLNFCRCFSLLIFQSDIRLNNESGMNTWGEERHRLPLNSWTVSLKGQMMMIFFLRWTVEWCSAFVPVWGFVRWLRAAGVKAVTGNYHVTSWPATTAPFKEPSPKKPSAVQFNSLAGSPSCGK